MSHLLELSWKTYFEMEAGNNGQFLHGELLGRLLVAVTATAFDLGAASQMLWSSESARHLKMYF